MISSTAVAFLDTKKGVWGKKTIFFFGPFVGAKDVKPESIVSALSSKYGPFGKDEPGSVTILKAQNGLYVQVSYEDERAYTAKEQKAIEAEVVKVVKV